MVYDLFKERLVGGGARQNLFKVIPSFPDWVVGADTSTASFMIKTASLPASTVGTVQIMFRGRPVHYPGERTFDQWSITVMNDTDFAVRKMFERWSDGINRHTTNTGRATPSEYKVDMIVQQLDRGDDEPVLATYKIVGAWPTVIAPIELSYDAQNTYEEFPVELMIDRWENADTTT